MWQKHTQEKLYIKCTMNFLYWPASKVGAGGAVEASILYVETVNHLPSLESSLHSSLFSWTMALTTSIQVCFLRDLCRLTLSKDMHRIANGWKQSNSALGNNGSNSGKQYPSRVLNTNSIRYYRFEFILMSHWALNVFAYIAIHIYSLQLYHITLWLSKFSCRLGYTFWFLAHYKSIN